MKNKALLVFISIFIVVGLIGNASAFAGSQEIKERMKDRLPQIIELKKQGAIGENNKGFLEFVGQQKPSKDVVDAENNDRDAVYRAIAQQTGSTGEAVGQRRAIQIAGSANAGDWVQDGGGKWYQK